MIGVPMVGAVSLIMSFLQQNKNKIRMLFSMFILHCTQMVLWLASIGVEFSNHKILFSTDS